MPVSRKPAAPQDDLLNAIAAVKSGQDRASRKSKRRKHAGDAGSFVKQWVRNLVVLALAVLLVLLIDGIRRERKEFAAVMTNPRGPIKVILADEGPTAATDGLKLHDDDVVETGANATCTLVMGEGSAVELEPGTRFQVRVLGYDRGGKRDRSFMVERGAAVSKVGQFFGAESQATVCTPTAVAAVRGTAFRVSYDPEHKTSTVQTVEGKVDVKSPTGAVTQAPAGRAVDTSGYSLGTPGVLDPVNQTQLKTKAGQLASYEQPPSSMNLVEATLTAIADPILQLIGIVPGGWGYNSIDSARRSACMEALKTLRTNLDSLADPPEVINLWTLEELQLDPKEKRRLIRAFCGQTLDSYKKNGHDWEMTATAPDKRRTRYRCTEGSIGKIEKENE